MEVSTSVAVTNNARQARMFGIEQLLVTIWTIAKSFATAAGHQWNDCNMCVAPCKLSKETELDHVTQYLTFLKISKAVFCSNSKFTSHTNATGVISIHLLVISKAFDNAEFLSKVSRPSCTELRIQRLLESHLHDHHQVVNFCRESFHN
jgi:hypothetical protein